MIYLSQRVSFRFDRQNRFGNRSGFSRVSAARGRAQSRGIVLCRPGEPVPVPSRCAKRQWHDLSGYGETRF